MAVFMIMDCDHTHIDPIKDQLGCYKRGDVVEILDDDKPLVLPPAPPFLFLRVSDKPKAESNHFMKHQFNSIVINGEDPIRRRRWKVEIDNLPTSVKNQLAKNRYCEVNYGMLRSRLRDKETGETA